MTARMMIGLAVLIAIGLYAAANAHLIWTAVQSQPDCVPNLKDPGPNGQFRAARPSS
jgi:hypothetical protein